MKKRSELSLNELIKYKSILKASLIALGIVTVLAASSLFYLNAQSVLFIPVLLLSVIALPIFISLKSMSDEIISRNSQSAVEL